MMEEKLKKQMDIAAAKEVPSPPSPPSRHEKWKMACTKPGGQMTSEKSIQGLIVASSDLYQEPFPIPWDATLFGVDNGNIPLYVSMSDLWEIIQGNQMLNIAVIQLWIM